MVLTLKVHFVMKIEDLGWVVSSAPPPARNVLSEAKKWPKEGSQENKIGNTKCSKSLFRKSVKMSDHQIKPFLTVLIQKRWFDHTSPLPRERLFQVVKKPCKIDWRKSVHHIWFSCQLMFINHFLRKSVDILENGANFLRFVYENPSTLTF